MHMKAGDSFSDRDAQPQNKSDSLVSISPVMHTGLLAVGGASHEYLEV